MRWLLPLGAAALLLPLLWWVAAPPEPLLLIDRPAPEMTAVTALGEQVTDGELRGEVVVVNMFASWCLPCIEEIPLLGELPEGITLIGIAWKDRPQDTARLFERLENPYDRVIPDERGASSVPWGLTGIPETFVIDHRWRIRLHLKEPLTAALLRDQVAPLLRELQRASGSGA